MNDKVLNQLMKLTATEKKRLKYQEFYDDVPKNAYAEMGPDSIINNFFFEQKKFILVVTIDSLLTPLTPIHFWRLIICCEEAVMKL